MPLSPSTFSQPGVFIHLSSSLAINNADSQEPDGHGDLLTAVDQRRITGSSQLSNQSGEWYHFRLKHEEPIIYNLTSDVEITSRSTRRPNVDGIMRSGSLNQSRELARRHPDLEGIREFALLKLPSLIQYKVLHWLEMLKGHLAMPITSPCQWRTQASIMSTHTLKLKTSLKVPASPPMVRTKFDLALS
jgi:hypothetical protein